jgi:16S rRNA (cytidine1402-2'-O)-methyltransferase
VATVHGTLLVVATPIGNLDDLSPRAAAALRDADCVLAEDTRRTATLLRHADADTPMQRHHLHNEARSTAEAITRLREGATIVLVSDAGTPLISDPGQRLVEAAVEAGVTVEAVPGPSALLHALVVSAMPAARFCFEGFLPRRGAEREDRLAAIAGEPRTSVWFVAPHHAAEDVAAFARACGTDRPAALCRELTKLHEDVVRGSLGELAARVSEQSPRGEVTLVIAGAPPADVEPPTEQELVAAVGALVEDGMRARDAAGDVAAAHGLRKNAVYETWLRSH